MLNLVSTSTDLMKASGVLKVLLMMWRLERTTGGNISCMSGFFPRALHSSTLKASMCKCLFLSYDAILNMDRSVLCHITVVGILVESQQC